MILNTAMNYPTNQLHLMISDDDLGQFWSNTFGLEAENYKTMFCGPFREEYGIYALYNKIEKEIVENNISLLLIEISSPIYDPFVIFDLKQKYGLMVVLLAIDDEFKFDWISSSYATVADLVLTSDYVSVNRYRQSGVNARFFTLPVYIPHETPSRSMNDLTPDISFVGVVDDKPSRMEFVRFLARCDINVSWFSNSGSKDPLYLSRDEMYSIFLNSAINLNFTGMTTYLKCDNPLFKRIRTIKLRPFEIAAAGGFCISEFSISLAECFEDGVDIVFFKNKTELLEKIQYFLIHQDEAKKIAANGAQKIKKQFSGEATAKRLVKLIQGTQEHFGTDLYGEPHRVKTSRWLASSFMTFTLWNSVSLLVKGKLTSFFHDFWGCFKFLRRLSVEEDAIVSLRVAFMASYTLGKIALAKIRSVIFSIATKFSWIRASKRPTK